MQVMQPYHQAQSGTAATMRNRTAYQMTLQRFYNWSGRPEGGSFPATIMPGAEARFTHLKAGAFGSSGAVVYKGMNAQGFSCEWLLAWDAPANSDPVNFPNKVHVACGADFIIEGMHEKRILADLSIAINMSKCDERSTKTSAFASITEDVPGVASLIADFDFLRQ